jgi:hypothetical protein
VSPSSSNWIGPFHAESAAPLRAKKAPATLAKALGFAKAWSPADLVDLTLGLEASLAKRAEELMMEGSSKKKATTTTTTTTTAAAAATMKKEQPAPAEYATDDDEDVTGSLAALRAKVKAQRRTISALRAQVAKLEGELAGRPATPGGKRKRTTGSTDGAAKRPLNPYQQFCKEQQPIVRAESPHLSSAEVMRVIAGRWRARIGIELDPPVASSTTSTAAPTEPKRSSSPPPKVVRISIVGNEVVDTDAPPPAAPAPSPPPPTPSSGPVKFAIVGNELVPI